MANLAISAVCNQDCAYCFTVDHLEHSRQPDPGVSQKTSREFLPVNTFQERLDFLARSNIQEVRLLGGEPTLHPQFAELIECILAKGMHLVVFTNGLMPETSLACLEAIPSKTCTVLVNVNQPITAEDDVSHRWRRDTMRRLGDRALVGFNIYRSSFQLDFLLPLIAETGCKPAIRLGMAQPCLSGNNQHILPGQYRAIAIRITRFACKAADAGVTLDFDCGFVRCMFSDRDLKTLQASGAKVGWRCNPILDVDVDGYVLHCYPLARLARLPLTQEIDAVALRNAFEARTRPYRQAGVFKECSTCPLRAEGPDRDDKLGLCSGGCLATTIRRFRHTPFSLEMPGDSGNAPSTTGIGMAA